MDSNLSKMKRVELVKQLNENLILISNKDLELKNIKKLNNELESQVKIENQNNTIFSDEYNKLCKDLEKAIRSNQELIDKSKQLDENIQGIQKKIDEDNN